MMPLTMHKIVTGGFGDPLNHYAHSGAWFQGRLFIGTSRANLQFLKLGKLNVEIPHWPVEDLGVNYTPDFEKRVSAAEIWSLSKLEHNAYKMKCVYQSPYHPFSTADKPFRSEISYRSMCVYKDSGRDQCLFVSTTSRSNGDGPDLLCSRDGNSFQRLPKPHTGQASKGKDKCPRFSSIRNLIQFDDLLVTCVTGGTKGNINHSLNTNIYASQSPETGAWVSINGVGFGSRPEYFCVFSLCAHHGHLYAGTAGLNGFALFKGTRTGTLKFKWELVVDRGAGRGSLNQGIVSMCSFGDDLYLGSGIQNGGYDRVHNVGPAAFEVLRMNAAGSIELLVGSDRQDYSARSSYGPGFSNPFNAYLWKMEVHRNHLYVGTLDTSIFSLFTSVDKLASFSADKISRTDLLEWLMASGGADLRRTKDGELWEPVTTNGFANFYNYGIRSLVSNGDNLFIGTANPFGPRIWNTETMRYETNLLCGTEIIMIDR
jgi:hypothetical protein